MFTGFSGDHMSKIKATLWKIDAHTLRKHEILKRYFQAWLPIMASWNGRVLFVDGFAGPGEYADGEIGSPVLVLQEARDHTYPITAEVVFLFVESDEQRFEHLVKTLDELKPTLPNNFKFECVNGKFNEELTKVLNYIEKQKTRLAPALVFIDPFGFSHTPFATVARILKNARSEVLITFMYEEINRFINLAEQENNYDELFGTLEWRKARQESDSAERRRILHDVYLGQLRKHAKYVRSFEMLNKGNKTDYFLFFASNNLRGLEKMKEAMWKVDATGEFQFSDYTDQQGFTPLFADRPDYDCLKKMILQKYANSTVDIGTLGDFVVADTPFLRTHIKTQILKPMEISGELHVVDPKLSRRKGTFPDGTLIHFD